MIAIDSSVLIDLLADGPQADAAEACLRQCLGNGPVVICDVALAEVCSALRDGVSALAQHGWLGSALTSPAVGYSFVYHLEIGLLFATLVAVGPLVRTGASMRSPPGQRLGLAEMPG